jgi:hypothetical protein
MSMMMALINDACRSIAEQLRFKGWEGYSSILLRSFSRHTITDRDETIQEEV